MKKKFFIAFIFMLFVFISIGLKCFIFSNSSTGMIADDSSHVIDSREYGK